MKVNRAITEYEDYYSDSCANLLSKHIRSELRKRGADVWQLKAEWNKYLKMRMESIAYLRSIGEWRHTEPKESVRTMEVDEI